MNMNYRVHAKAVGKTIQNGAEHLQTQIMCFYAVLVDWPLNTATAQVFRAYQTIEINGRYESNNNNKNGEESLFDGWICGQSKVEPDKILNCSSKWKLTTESVLVINGPHFMR